MQRENSTPELRAKYKAALNKALLAGHAILKEGGEAMDAAVAAVTAMEGKLPSVPNLYHLNATETAIRS